MTGTAYRCPKYRKRMRFASSFMTDRGPAAEWRCPRCGTSATIMGD